MTDREIFDRMKVLRNDRPKSLLPQHVQKKLDANRASAFDAPRKAIMSSFNASTLVPVFSTTKMLSS